MARFRALIFDLDNTLVDRDAAVRRYLYDVARRFGASERLDAVEARILAVDAMGYCPRHEFARRSVELLELACSADAFLEDFLGRIGEHVRPDPRVDALLARLSPHHELALVTNGGGRTQRAKLARARLESRFVGERLLISGEFGCAKPEPAIFHAALEALACTPDEALFVGDHPAHDVQGARDVGLATCWISRGRAFPAHLEAPDFSLDSVLQLEELLRL